MLTSQDVQPTGLGERQEPGKAPDAIGFTDVIDVAAVQSLMERFYEVAGVPVGILDLTGRIIVGVGWQDVCTKFHRVHPETCRNCVESDTKLAAGVAPGEFRLYRCKNNMWDIATPLLVDGRHVANIFSGQFFFEDEVFDEEAFRLQAERYGFDADAYVAALLAAPRLSRAKVEAAMRFIIRLAEMLSDLGRSNLELARAMKEREALLASLRRSESDLAHAQMVARTGSWRLDVRTDRLDWSDEVYRLFGIQPGTQLTYEDFLLLVHPEDREKVRRAWQAALAGEGYDIEHRINSPEGVKWVRERAELEFGAGGALLGGFGTVQDITELKQAQESLRAQAAELEHANRLKDEFLATLSHELRTPLNAILGWAHLLAEGKLEGEEQKKAVERIERSARLQARLVEDVLDMSRIVTGRLRLDLQPVDLRDVVLAGVESVSAAAAAKRIDLVATVPPGTCILGDPARLQQVFWNLLSNAVKFTSEGGRVEVTMHNGDGGAEVRVRDSGIGISPDFMPSLFQRFSQRDSSTTRRHGGLGLGLATVRHLVELHGGTVSAESPGEGQGATFIVRLPFEARERR